MVAHGPVGGGAGDRWRSLREPTVRHGVKSGRAPDDGPLMRADDTIYAPATPAGRGGIAVVRISGDAAHGALEAIAGPVPPARVASVRQLRDQRGELLDVGLVLRFERGASFTGEPMAELQVHGGPAVVSAVLDDLAARPGLRIAEPGEFTLRAFRNGRMDLTEVEALGDLLAAETEGQRQQAARLISGALRQKLADWRAALLRAVALVEVTIDWVDEDVPEDVAPEVRALLSDVRTGITEELAASDGAIRLRQGFEVALVGAPNAGKSSLLNVLSGHEAAIVSPLAGTTRDVIAVRHDIGGLPVTFLDMAGIRDAGDMVEREGVRRARERAEAADLRVFLAAPDAPLGDLAAWVRAEDILVAAKSDLGGGQGLAVSAQTGTGIGDLLNEISARLRQRTLGGLVAHRRQKEALEQVVTAIYAAEQGLDLGSPELVSEDIRRGLQALARLTGAVGTEEILGEIFGRFCLGK